MARQPSASAAPGDPPLPGASPLAFLHGDFAEATVGGVTFNIFEWRVEFRTSLMNTRAHGQRWARKTVIESDWVFTGRGYIAAGSASHAPNAGFANDAADPPAITVAGYSGSSGSGTKIFEGPGIMTRGTLDAPDGAMAVQDIEIEGNGAPTTGV
ncbi:MAG TPA: hypothetical protein VIM84_07845 [Gemmatimonadales bacterium]